MAPEDRFLVGCHKNFVYVQNVAGDLTLDWAAGSQKETPIYFTEFYSRFWIYLFSGVNWADNAQFDVGWEITRLGFRPSRRFRSRRWVWMGVLVASNGLKVCSNKHI